MTIASAAGISSKELEDFIDAQKADLVLTKFRELSRVDLLDMECRFPLKGFCIRWWTANS